MGVSIIDTQRDIILDTWKVLVVDEASRKLIDNVVNEDDILNENITNIEVITDRRPMNKDMDVVYILSPQPHIVDCIMADFERRRYRKTYLIWTSLLPGPLRDRIDKSQMAREQIQLFKVLNVEYFPRESHVVTFRDPWSFPILFHPACNNLAMAHDLLPIKEGDKVTYKTVINEGEPDQEEKDMELGEKDKIWVENRHTHMKDTIEKIMADFKRFIDENPHFTKADADSTNLNTIKDMIAGLPQFQEQKGSYSLHLAMAQDCMNVFQRCKLMDIASVEQVPA
ncbi:putative sec1 family superfamily protein [Neofusicoccum parvum UCRNP2]|uniref:Putative sec1 family superfamily protein n=1 Tax=Botryosphaeria parva (strain UCR-NP2) TaxID=1287680 RepID=R1EU21_BOTPV|nr:putative sec1 family superfamily protein [Neofusicoccum parvum UCRNP2]